MNYGTLPEAILALANLIIASANAILVFSLLIYILTHNLRSPVARAFATLLSFLSIVYLGDIVLFLVTSFEAAAFWLKIQWIGIAFIPAVYLYLSDALLRTTNSLSPFRFFAVRIASLVSALFLLLAAFTDLIITDGIQVRQIFRFSAGRYFPLFAVYFFVVSLWSVFNIWRARGRCLTPTSRRRMTYLTLAFIAPGLSVFPYLLIASDILSLTRVFVLSFIGGIGVAFMIVVMAYSIAYYGVLTPDRVVKHTLVHYLLRGPFVGTCVIIVMLTIPHVERIWGIPRDTMLIIAVIGTISILQGAINLAKPLIDRVLHSQDQAEISWIQKLDTRLLTTTDLKQLLENVLTALCDLLRVRTGVVLVRENDKLEAEATSGMPEMVDSLLTSSAETLAHLDKAAELVIPEFDFQILSFNGHWIIPLRTKSRDQQLGTLLIEAPWLRTPLPPKQNDAVNQLIHQAEMALEDRQLQQHVFASLQHIIPEIEQLQRWRGTPHYITESGDEQAPENPLYTPEFPRLVKKALSHYWGGPNLSKSPLTNLQIVQQQLGQHDNNPTKALRAVLDQAIESLRPEGQRRMTTADWLLFNILDLKFIEGRKVREIINRLAMSESDFYRKQRVAVSEVARALARMEEDMLEQKSQ